MTRIHAPVTHLSLCLPAHVTVTHRRTFAERAHTSHPISFDVIGFSDTPITTINVEVEVAYTFHSTVLELLWLLLKLSGDGV